jgi:hypothetical protein
MLVGGVGGRVALHRTRHPFLGVTKDFLRRCTTILAAFLGGPLLGKGLGASGRLLAQLVRTHTGAYPDERGRNRAVDLSCYSAESFFHWSQLRVQSQMSPSLGESWTGVPLTSTGSP